MPRESPRPERSNGGGAWECSDRSRPRRGGVPIYRVGLAWGPGGPMNWRWTPTVWGLPRLPYHCPRRGTEHRGPPWGNVCLARLTRQRRYRRIASPLGRTAGRFAVRKAASLSHRGRTVLHTWAPCAAVSGEAPTVAPWCRTSMDPRRSGIGGSASHPTGSGAPGTRIGGGPRTAKAQERESHLSPVPPPCPPRRGEPCPICPQGAAWLSGWRYTHPPA